MRDHTPPTVLVALGDRPGEPAPASSAWPTREAVTLSRAITVLLVLALLALVVWARHPWEQVQFVAAGLAVIAIGLEWFLEPTAYLPGSARMVAERGPVRFVARPLGPRMLVCAALVFVVLGAVMLWMLWDLAVRADPDAGISAIRLRAYVLPAVGLLCAVVLVRTALRARRVPRGVTVDRDGVVAAWNGTVQRVAWDNLYEANTDPGRTFGPALRVWTKRSGVGISVLTGVTGSDPAVLAAFINHFRDHPEDRTLLAQPQLAWERFRASFAPDPD